MLFDERCGHSPSTSPTRNTSSNSPYRAACASSSCTPAVTGARRKRLPFDPSANHRGDARRARPANRPGAGAPAADRESRTAPPCARAGAARAADRRSRGCDRARRETRAAHRAAPTAVLFRPARAAPRRRRPPPCAAFHRVERPQVLDAAEIAFVAERAIQRRDIRSPYRRAVDCEREVRRAEQRHDRLAREVRGDELEDQIERRRIRLCRQRQRVERLIRNAGVRKHIPREIHVRQRPLEHHRAAIEIGRPGCLHAGRDRGQLVFAVAAHGERLRLRRQR